VPQPEPVNITLQELYQLLGEKTVIIFKMEEHIKKLTQEIESLKNGK
jgi:uncharacterized coiled-coil protein SlyX